MYEKKAMEIATRQPAMYAAETAVVANNRIRISLAFYYVRTIAQVNNTRFSAVNANGFFG